MSLRRRAASFVISLLFVSAPAFAQTPPKQAPKKKPPVKTATKPAAKKPATPAEAPKPAPPPPDLSITAKYVTGDKSTAGTILLHGARERVTYDGAIASVQQCDLHRGVQLNTDTRVYLEMPDPAVPPTPTYAPGEKHKGGTITYTTAIADTGEKKDMFGFTARHLKTTVTKESSPDALDKRPEKVEIDGWYIDLPDTVSCTGAPPPEKEIRADAKDASASDVVTYVRPPAAKNYPVSYTMVTTSGTDAPATTQMEATEVKRITADAQQFEIPSDYIAVNSAVQLTADHRPGVDGPKHPGTLRVGIAPVANSSGQSIATSDLSQALLESLEEQQIDVVLLKTTGAAAQADEAKARFCDFILTNNVSEIKRPGRGILGKLSNTSGDALSAKVDFTLIAPGAAKPEVRASAHSGTTMLHTAVGAAMRVSQYITPFGAARLGYMRAFSAMSGNAAPGMMRQTQDPMLSTVFALVDRATGNKPEPVITDDNGAAAAALLKEVDDIVAELKKRKA